MSPSPPDGLERLVRAEAELGRRLAEARQRAADGIEAARREAEALHAEHDHERERAEARLRERVDLEACEERETIERDAARLVAHYEGVGDERVERLASLVLEALLEEERAP